MNETFPNLAAIGVLVICNGGGCHYVRRIDLHAELSKRGLWQKFVDGYSKRSRSYTPFGDFIAWDAEQTILEILAQN